ncbi:MAG TPA: transporter substrate-binding domain-containing protein [Myxococcota bacterium]|nr:transporter substrate-binding domain-containing protein [Myxococcota bacterium]
MARRTGRFLSAALLLLAAACAHPRVLRIGTSGDYAPFSSESGGFDVEVAQRLAERLGMRVEWVHFRWPELERDLREGRIDVAMSGVTWLPSRALVGYMSRAVASGGACVIGPETARRIGVNRGGALERWARAALAGREIVAVDDNRALPGLLASGAVDAIVTDSFELDAFLRPGDAHRCEPPRERKVYWVSPARAAALGPRIDRFLHDEEDWLDEERERWLGGSAPRAPLDHVIDLLARRLALMPGLGAWKRAAGVPIADPEREARVLERAEAAARARGLDRAAVREFFALQIELARAVQERAGAAAEPLPLEPARALLERLGDEIVAGLAEVAGSAGLDPERLAPLGEWLEPAEVERVARALEGLVTDRVLEGWRATASELRGLPFVQRVPLFWLTRAELPQLVRGELADVLGDDYATPYRDAIAAIGLVPRDLDLGGLMIRLNQDQIAGLYSVQHRAMYVLGNSAQADVPIVIHELVHALQHQHFPRGLELMQKLRRNDDVVLALGAAAEGDAMLAMLRYSLGSGPLSPEAAQTLRAGLREDLEHPSGMLAQVPRIMRVSMLFPYAAGFDMAERSFRAEGREGLDRMLRDPPLSSLRVWRPDAAQPVEFVGLPLARAAALAGRGCRAGHDNVVGAVGLEVLFADHGAPQASAALEPAWSGDRFARVDCPRGAQLLWVTRWTTPEAAAAFASAYAGIASSVAKVAPLAGTPRAELRGRTVLVATPRLARAADALLPATELRSYAGFADWVRDGCFPESPCPQEPAP